MANLIDLVRQQWGKELECDYCNDKTTSLKLCGACMSVTYCNAQCQQASWIASHRTRCKLIANGVKRGREDGQEEQGKTDAPATRAFSMDEWNLILQFLNLEDIKNASQASKALLRSARVQMIANHNFRLPADPADRNRFLDSFGNYLGIIHFVGITADDVQYLKETRTWDRLRHIAFHDDFYQSVDIPAGLQSVTFGSRFNQRVVLPAGLQSVEFGHNFNQPVVLPAGLKTLILARRDQVNLIQGQRPANMNIIVH